MSKARYAVYFTPTEGSELGRVCSSVLGRCVWTGLVLEQPALRGISSTRLTELTASPRHYGLHGTLKPPFFLSNKTTETELLDAVAALVARRKAFDLPPLQLETIDSFLALTPLDPCTELDDLARNCVVDLDRFRQPPGPEELARRRGKGLAPAQDRLLARWGYPYVLEEFRFHLTLTDGIPDLDERLQVHAALTTALAPALRSPVPVRDICVFRQAGAETAFTVLASFPLFTIA